MQKSKGIKIAAFLGGAIAAIAGIVLAAGHLGKGQESYRSILIYGLEGSAQIERDGAGSIKAAEDLYLESGDRLTVADGSSIRLKLDDDKYMMVEENSVLSIEAVGNEQDSKTKIQLEQGAITSEIRNPLSTDSTYEVNSPNSVMAVRGTIFRVETEPDEDEETYTTVSVFSGKVSMATLLEDGTTGDEVLINAGEEAACIGNNISGIVMSDVAEIDYGGLPLQVLSFLLELADQDAPISGITKEELNGLVEEAQSWEDSEEEDWQEEGSEEEGWQEEGSEEEGWQEEGSEEEDWQEEGSEEGTDSSNEGTSSYNNYNSSTGSSTSSWGSGSSGGTTPRTNPGSNPGGSPGTNPGSNPGSSPGTAPGTNPGTGDNPADTKPKKFTVKFMYDGEVFATQTVKSGKCAKKPILMPEKSGKWDFDFSEKIKKDTIIKWK